MKALEKDPASRYPRMIDLLLALTTFLRGWDRQTREMASEACARYHEIEALLAARRGAGTGNLAEEVAAAPLLRDLPLFEERGGDVLTVVPFRRAKILEIRRVLDEQHARLVAGGGTGPAGS
jgi:hypothetical protein